MLVTVPGGFAASLFRGLLASSGAQHFLLPLSGIRLWGNTFMKTSTFAFAAALLCSQYAQAASVSLPNLTTSTSGNSGSLASQNQWSVDLNDRSGLTPGAPIVITVSTSEHFLWIMSFSYGVGNLSMSNAAALAMTVGTQVAVTSQTLTQDFGFVSESSGLGGPAGSVGGYLVGSGLSVLTLTVPWSADLSSVGLRLSQSASITGTTATLHSSLLNISGGFAQSTSSNFTYQLASLPIPEPGSVGLLSFLAFVVASRRRC
jgi:hypothetical protein